MEVDLFDNGDVSTPRPAWQVIEAARRRYLTGVLTLDTTPPTNVYLRDGQVYFAERTTDGGLGVRLLVEGVITREQMHKATLQVSGVEHLGRMFERDTSIDRDAVELCVELMTDDVLAHVADAQISGWKLQLYRRHPSGLDRWLPTRVEVVTHLVERRELLEDDAVVTPGDGPRSRPHLTPPPPAPIASPIPAAPPVAAAAVAPVVAAPATPVAPPPVMADAPVAEPAPVVEHVAHVEPPVPVPTPATDPTTEMEVVAADPLHERTGLPGLPPPVTGEHAVIAPAEPAHVVEPEPIEAEPVDDQPAASEEPALPERREPGHGLADSGIHLADSAMEQLVGGNIADEVAEAVRRALAAIDVPQ